MKRPILEAATSALLVLTGTLVLAPAGGPRGGLERPVHVCAPRGSEVRLALAPPMETESEVRVLSRAGSEAAPLDVPPAAAPASPAPPSLRSLSLPALPEGLLYDPDATVEDIARHHSSRPYEDLVRTRLRLVQWLAVDPAQVALERVRDPRVRHFFTFRDAALAEGEWFGQHAGLDDVPFTELVPRELYDDPETRGLRYEDRGTEDLHVELHRARRVRDAFEREARARKVERGDFERALVFG